MWNRLVSLGFSQTGVNAEASCFTGILTDWRECGTVLFHWDRAYSQICVNVEIASGRNRVCSHFNYYIRKRYRNSDITYNSCKKSHVMCSFFPSFLCLFVRSFVRLASVRCWPAFTLTVHIIVLYNEIVHGREERAT